ncbi:H-NS histone family protein [Rhodobacter sphaeroides]|uniref:H-NS family nucleoid-associated regulatory protein n=1 Tax=Cereibacter sphaeroides TaxID=1063 RepID=UPI001325A8B9|nr:H-NS family nucleoid-associated regulatory protein [Cereibacter sphaeroides]MWP37267.1 H-NS histone family protein [Cereibacter sphaeroides]
MKKTIERLNWDELLDLYGRISKALDACETRQAAAKARSMAAAISKGAGSGAKRVSYFNPANRAVSWNGRGRCPNWFKVAMAQGRTPEELASL